MQVCTIRLLPHRADRIRQAFQPVADQHAHTSRTPRFLISDKTRSQYFAFPVAVLPGPQSQHVTLPHRR